MNHNLLIEWERLSVNAVRGDNLSNFDIDRFHRKLDAIKAENGGKLPELKPNIIPDRFARNIIKYCQPFQEFTVEYAKLLSQSDERPPVKEEALKKYCEYAKLLQYTEEVMIRVYGMAVEWAFIQLTEEKKDVPNIRLFRSLFTLLSIMETAKRSNYPIGGVSDFEAEVEKYRKEIESYEQTNRT